MVQKAEKTNNLESDVRGEGVLDGGPCRVFVPECFPIHPCSVT